MGLDEAALDLIAGCATNLHVHPGTYLFREGEPADTFYVVRRGRVALEVHEPAGGARLLDTVEDGEELGWSWLVPPHRWFLDARAIDEASLISIDGRCLRGKCDEDPCSATRDAAGGPRDVPPAAVGPGAAARRLRGPRVDVR